MSLFRYETDANGVPTAHPIAGAHAGLARFLNEEVSSVGYADVLLDSIREAKESEKAQVSTGNSWAAEIGPVDVTIRHLHVGGHKEVSEVLAVFERAVGEWRALLSGSEA